MSAPLARRLGSESGFTLVELLAAIVIGMVVLFAIFALLDRSVVATQEVSDREQALQRGRLAMELITRQLRSQVCLNSDVHPIVQGDARQVTLHVDLGDGAAAPERRRLVHDPAARTITEHREVGTGTVPDVTYATPATSHVLLTRAQASPSEAVFRYYAFAAAAGTPGELDELPAPLTAANAARVVKIGVSFVTLPDRMSTQERLGTTLRESIFVRSADSAGQQGGPRCS